MKTHSINIESGAALLGEFTWLMIITDALQNKNFRLLTFRLLQEYHFKKGINDLPKN